MSPLAVAAAPAAGGVALGVLLAVAASRRVPVIAGTVTALALLPLAGRPFPVTAPWQLAGGAYLVAIAAGGWLLWVAARECGDRLPGGSELGVRGWALALGVTLVLGVALWPIAVEALDPGRTGDTRSAAWLDPARWGFGAGVVALVGGVGRLLPATDPLRVAAGIALVVGGTWLAATGLGAVVPDVLLPALGLVLPVSAAGAAAAARQPAI